MQNLSYINKANMIIDSKVFYLLKNLNSYNFHGGSRHIVFFACKESPLYPQLCISRSFMVGKDNSAVSAWSLTKLQA